MALLARLGTVLVALSPALMGISENPVAPKVFDEATAKKASEKVAAVGWNVALNLGASVALADNDGVVGQTNGLSMTLGGTFSATGGYTSGAHDWRNRLSLSLTFTRTPLIPDELLKTSDNFEFESSYYLRLLDWIGPFASLGVDAFMLDGDAIHPTEKTFMKKLLDGSVEEVTATRLHLNDAFRPMTFKQSLGAFVRPLRGQTIELEVRTGLAAREVLADGQFILEDDAKTDAIEVKQLRSLEQLGAEVATAATGSFYEGKVGYRASVEVMVPFLTDLPADDTRSNLELTNIEFGAKLSFKLVAWASLDYELKAMLQPQLIEEWQIQNNLLLTFGFATRWQTEAEAPKTKAAK